MPLDEAVNDLRCRVGLAALDLIKIQADLFQLHQRLDDGELLDEIYRRCREHPGFAGEVLRTVWPDAA